MSRHDAEGGVAAGGAGSLQHVPAPATLDAHVPGALVSRVPGRLTA